MTIAPIANGESGASVRTKLNTSIAKVNGVAEGATANATNAELRDRATHTGTQAASTITGLATVATSGAYSDLSGLPALGTAAAANTTDFATSAQGALADTAVQSDPTGVTGADAITNIISLTQAEYDAIGTKNASTLYIVTA
jgi:hypothetical protein